MGSLVSLNGETSRKGKKRGKSGMHARSMHFKWKAFGWIV